jgi:Lon protease-like protein
VPSIGLFPLGIVLLPAERTALHIFEPRYKELIGECLEQDRDFGIVLVDEAGLRTVGTRTSVVDVLERLEDGRLNIIVEGGDRFQVVEMTEGRSFFTAEITDYADAEPLPPEEAYEECLIEYRRVVTAAGLELEEPIPDQRGLAFRVAAQIALPPVARQQLLEMRSEAERLMLVRQLLEAAAVAARRRMIQQRAATNGHVRPA